MNPDETLHNRVAYLSQSVTCLATEACLTADPGVTSSILVQSHTFMKIGHEIISVVISSRRLNHSRWVVVTSDFFVCARSTG